MEDRISQQEVQHNASQETVDKSRRQDHVVNDPPSKVHVEGTVRNQTCLSPATVVSYNNCSGQNVSQKYQCIDLAKLLGNSNEPQRQGTVMINGEH